MKKYFVYGYFLLALIFVAGVNSCFLDRRLDKDKRQFIVCTTNDFGNDHDQFYCDKAVSLSDTRVMAIVDNDTTIITSKEYLHIKSNPLYVSN